MNLNKEKCNAWMDLIFALIRMSKNLNDMEYRYIRAKLSIEYGKLELQKLEEKHSNTNKKLKGEPKNGENQNK